MKAIFIGNALNADSTHYPGIIAPELIHIISLRWEFTGISAQNQTLILKIHEKTSVIITTNKAPTEWVQTLNDEVLATAIIDRLLYRCEVIRLAGKSYRLENRKTIFKPLSSAQDKQQLSAASNTNKTT